MKKRMITIIMLFVFITVLSTGCIIGLIKDPNTIGDWITLPEDGTKLTYYTIIYKNGVTQETETSTSEIVDVIEKDDYKGVHYEDTRGIDYYHWVDIENDQFLEGYYSEPSYYDIVLLDIPVEIGTSWYEYNGTDRKYEITEIGVTKTVDAGTFYDVIVVESEYSDSGGEYYDYYYISQGSGVIIYEMHQVTDMVYGNIHSTHIELTDID